MKLSKRLANNKTEAEDLGNSAREMIREKFDLETARSMWIGLMQKISQEAFVVK